MTMLAHEKQIQQYQKTLQQLKEQSSGHSLLTGEEIQEMEKKFEQLKTKVYSELTPWDRIGICRHQQRPHALDYIQNICDDYEEIKGDRSFQDDPSIVAAIAKINGEKFMLIGQEKGKDTESRLYRNFGMPHPEGYRKALRCMKLAEKFHLPIVTLLDTPGAYPGLAAEERGQGWAIAKNLLEMSRIATPIIVLIIGEGNSGGALGMGIGDVVGILEHAYYSVISPEGCASILWKDATKNSLAAATLKMHAEHLLELGIVDVVLPEPPGGAHLDCAFAYSQVKRFILTQAQDLKGYPESFLLEKRYQKFRRMGKFELTTNEALNSSRPSQQ